MRAASVVTASLVDALKIAASGIENALLAMTELAGFAGKPGFCVVAGRALLPESTIPVVAGRNLLPESTIPVVAVRNLLSKNREKPTMCHCEEGACARRGNL